MAGDNRLARHADNRREWQAVVTLSNGIHELKMNWINCGRSTPGNT
jgi:hypothetical protein